MGQGLGLGPFFVSENIYNFSGSTFDTPRLI